MGRVEDMQSIPMETACACLNITLYSDLPTFFGSPIAYPVRREKEPDRRESLCTVDCDLVQARCHAFRNSSRSEGDAKEMKVLEDDENRETAEAKQWR